MIMDGSKLVLIVVPVVIPLVLAVGVALPLIADRDNGRAFSSSRVATLRPGNSHISFHKRSARASGRSAASGAKEPARGGYFSRELHDFQPGDQLLPIRLVPHGSTSVRPRGLRRSS